METCICEKLMYWITNEPEAEAIKYYEKSFNYGELYEMVNIMATQLEEEGIKRGDSVAIFIPNSVELIIAIITLAFFDCTIIPVHFLTEKEKVKTILQGTDCKKILCNNLSYVGIEMFIKDAILLNTAELFDRKEKKQNESIKKYGNSFQFWGRKNISDYRVVNINKNLDDCINIYYRKFELDKTSTLALSQRIDACDSIASVLSAFMIGAKLVIYNVADICNPIKLLDMAKSHGVSLLFVKSAFLKTYLFLMNDDSAISEVKSIVLNDELDDKLIIDMSDIVHLRNVFLKVDLFNESSHTENEINEKISDILNYVKEKIGLSDYYILCSKGKMQFFYVHETDINTIEKQIKELTTTYGVEAFRLNRFYVYDDYSLNIDKNRAILEASADNVMASSTRLNQMENVIFNLIEIKFRLMELNELTEYNMCDSLIAMGLDSINYIQLIVWLEEVFNIEFDNDKIVINAFANCYDIINQAYHMISG